MQVTARSEQVCFGGRQGFYTHRSRETGTEMRFGVFVPPAALKGTLCKAVYVLAGLTCNEETFAIKAGAQRLAAELNLVLVTPDTSPRGLDLPEEHADWDFGAGAGFYLDATEAPWSAHYRMGSYIAEELPLVVEANFPVSGILRGIMGHSMGGHGALVTALKTPSRWDSVSALAPICHPCDVPWGQKAFPRYLGADPAAWGAYDATLLLRAGHRHPRGILIDQGEADAFLKTQLRPEALEAAARETGQPLLVRRQAGYDHSYWFIQSVIGDHLRHHAAP